MIFYLHVKHLIFQNKMFIFYYLSAIRDISQWCGNLQSYSLLISPPLIKTGGTYEETHLKSNYTEKKHFFRDLLINVGRNMTIVFWFWRQTYFKSYNNEIAKSYSLSEIKYLTNLNFTFSVTLNQISKFIFELNPPLLQWRISIVLNMRALVSI